MELPSSRPKSLAEVNAVPCVLCRSAVDGADTNVRMGVMVRVSFAREGGAREDCALRGGSSACHFGAGPQDVPWNGSFYMNLTSCLGEGSQCSPSVR